MLRHLKPSAPAVGAFAGHVVPFLLSRVFLHRLYDAAVAQDAQTGRFYYVLLLVMHVLGPVVGGVVAACLSRHQPLWHGLLSGVTGSVVVGLLKGFDIGWLVYCALAGVVGGWLCRRVRRAGA